MRHCDRGYTVVELVLAIAIMSILLGFAVPRFFDNDLFASRGYGDELAAALRYAQKVAVASGCRVRVTVDADGYALHQQAQSGNTCDPDDSSWTTAVRGPDGRAATGVVPEDVVVAVNTAFVFDPLGRLESGSPASFEVGGRRLSIDAGSGFVAFE
jgi:MSHA pilin protein MshC